MAARKKLIEVALPLDAVNAASAREKSIRHGHPSTLHLWWARRPLAAARAVIFAQMVDDPSEYVDVLLSDPKKKRAAQRALKQRQAVGAASAGRPDATDEWAALGAEAAALERERLFGILRELVRWENTTNEEVLERARTEIWQSWRRACAAHADHPRADELFDRHRLPAFHDPFAGGGSLPLEAQRLGLEAHASDLNPVAVLINKAMLEVPPKFAGRPPAHPAARADATLVEKTWQGAQGLAEDVRRYGRWMRDEAEKRIGHLYPPVEITPVLVRERPDLKPYAGRKLTVIAWLRYARVLDAAGKPMPVREALAHYSIRITTRCSPRRKAASAPDSRSALTRFESLFRGGQWREKSKSPCRCSSSRSAGWTRTTTTEPALPLLPPLRR